MLLLRRALGLGQRSSVFSAFNPQGPKGSEAKVRFPSETLDHFGISYAGWDKHAFPGRLKVSPRGCAEVPERNLALEHLLLAA